MFRLRKSLPLNTFLKNGDSEKGNDESGILINRNGEVIHFNRGGCVHFGISIESISSKKYTEEEFHQKVISLVSEFGSELVNVEELKTSIFNKNWYYEEGYYFVKIETVDNHFEMGHDGQGKVYASFYNN